MIATEFNKKLQDLRKAKGLTQEELAEVLFVSRTAISKWESGRGYPNIDSLKALAKFFDITVDDLLSGDELLIVAEEDNKQKETHFRDQVFGLLDFSMALFFFLPLFRQKAEGIIQGASLLSLTGISFWLKAVYLIVVVGLIVWGVVTLALQNYQHPFWIRNKYVISLVLNAVGAFLFIIGLQPYAAAFLFTYLFIKMSILIKKR